MKKLFADQWQHLSKRERYAVVLFAAFCAVFLAVQGFYRPQAARLAKAKGEWQHLRDQVTVLRSSLPKLDQDRERLRLQQEEIERLRQEVRDIEGRLITVGDLGALVGQLAKQGEGLTIDFESIRQQIKEDPDKPSVMIDVSFSASYEDTLNYLRRVERLSAFLKAHRLDMAEPKEGPKTKADVKLTLTTPLRLPGELGESAAPAPAAPLEKLAVSRSPFTSKQRPIPEAKRKKVKVSGITWHGDASTAIINNEVVRVNDHVDSLIVQKILPDTVILFDGVESYAVGMEAS